MKEAHRDGLVARYDPILHERLEKISKVSIRYRSDEPGGFYIAPSQEQAAETYWKIVENAAEHLNDVNFKSVVAPVSGGADSTLMLKILRIERENIGLRNLPEHVEHI